MNLLSDVYHLKLKGITMIQDIITFYRNPYACFQVGDRESIKERTIALRKTYFFCLYIAIMIIIIIIILDGILKNIYNISIYENLRKMRDEFRNTNTHIGHFIKLCVIAPFIEESLFRLPLLTRFSLLRWILFLVLIQYFFYWPFHLDIFFWEYYAILILIFVGIMVFNRIYAKSSVPILEPKKYNYLCWGLTLVFALVHIGNFAPLNWSFIYLYPIYVLPQFVYGVVFS